jgi:nitrile hydratase accessory protein
MAERTIADALVEDVEGPAAPPRSNGELVFDAPWESRAFGLAVALCERGTFEWEAFRRQLIAEIGEWEGARAAGDGSVWSYYERWLASLERLLVGDAVLNEREIEERARELEHHDAHEHDHAHHHHHDH